MICQEIFSPSLENLIFWKMKALLISIRESSHQIVVQQTNHFHQQSVVRKRENLQGSKLINMLLYTNVKTVKKPVLPVENHLDVYCFKKRNIFIHSQDKEIKQFWTKTNCLYFIRLYFNITSTPHKSVQNSTNLLVIQRADTERNLSKKSLKD